MKRRNFTVEFKQQAVDLAKVLGSAAKAAEQLGITDGRIHQWRKKLGLVKNNSFSVKTASVSPEQEEMKRLRQENAELKKVNHILKAAAAFFSQDHLK
jgi:transposase